MNIKQEFLDVFRDSAMTFVCMFGCLDKVVTKGGQSLSVDGLVVVMIDKYWQLSANNDRVGCSDNANAHSAICAVLSRVAV